MPLIIAEVHRRDRGDWRIQLSSETGAQAVGKTRREALAQFKEKVLPCLKHSTVLFLIYTDLDHVDQVWCFRGGRSRRLHIAAWLHK